MIFGYYSVRKIENSAARLCSRAALILCKFNLIEIYLPFPASGNLGRAARYALARLRSK